MKRNIITTENIFLLSDKHLVVLKGQYNVMNQGAVDFHWKLANNNSGKKEYRLRYKLSKITNINLQIYFFKKGNCVTKGSSSKK